MAYIRTETVNHWLVVRFLTDRLTDPFTVQGVMTDMDAAMAKLPERGRVAVNFSGVEYVSSQVIGMLLNVREQIAERNGTLVLCKLGKHVIDVMKITKLDRHFTISDSVSAVVGKRERATARRADVTWVD